MPASSSSLIHPALAHVASAVESNSLSGAGVLAALARVPDPRKRRGVRHSITTVLAVAACAVLAGCRSFTAISEWAANASEQALAAMRVHTVPSESCIRRTLQRLDGDELDTAIGQWATARTEPAAGARRVIAVDGKTIRGSGSESADARHLLAAIDHRTGVVLGQVDVCSKTNEIPMFSQLIDRIDRVEGAVVTADALHAQKAHADYLLLERQADYLLSVKANQPTLHNQLTALPWTDVPVAHRSTNRGHGRIEQRTLKVVTIRTGIVFPHARQALQVTRKTRRINAKSTKWTTVETVYAVTSVAADEARPVELAAWVRGHWAVETRLHWVRDVTLDEDRSQVRTGNAPRTMASLRNLVISMLRTSGVTNIARGLRHHAWDPTRPITLLLTS